MKRYPKYIPEPFRYLIMDEFTKRELAELVWDYVIRTRGEDQPDDEHYHDIMNTHRILTKL